MELLRHAHEFRTFFFLHIFPLIGIGSFWNLLIIIYFVKINIKNLKKMSLYHFLIVNLAIVDLCISVGEPIFYHHLVNKPLWEPGSSDTFRWLNFVETVCTIASCWLLVLISFVQESTKRNMVWLVCVFGFLLFLHKLMISLELISQLKFSK